MNRAFNELDAQERAMMRESVSAQQALLRQDFTPEIGRLQDRVTAFLVIAVLGWIGFFAMVWMMVNLLKDLEHERAPKRSAGGGGVHLPMREGVAAKRAALRCGVVPVRRAGVGAAAEAGRAVGGVSASGGAAGDDVGDGGLNFQSFAGRGVSSGDPSRPPSLTLRPALNFTEEVHGHGSPVEFRIG